MYPIMPSTQFAQMVLLHWTKWPPELELEKKATSPESPVPIQNNFLQLFS